MPMKRRALASMVALFSLFSVSSAFAAEDVRGLWKIIDEKTDRARGYVVLYIHGGKLYGRMVATIDDDTGRIKDTLEKRSSKADKLVGDPYFAGLDFVYSLEDRGKEWKGRIMDPESGDEYECRLWKNGDKLTVRGQIRGLGFLGRNQTWVRADAAELADFQLPDPGTFSPSIPRKK